MNEYPLLNISFVNFLAGETGSVSEATGASIRQQGGQVAYPANSTVPNSIQGKPPINPSGPSK
jgi:hypothetical protein